MTEWNEQNRYSFLLTRHFPQALNIARHGFSISVYNRTTSKVTDFVEGRGKDDGIIGTHSAEEFAASLAKPRVAIILVKVRSLLVAWRLAPLCLTDAL